MSKLPTRAAATLTATAGLVLITAESALAAPVTQPKPQLPDGMSEKLSTVLGVFMALVLVACVAGVFICAARLALAFRHGEGAESVGRLGGVAAACVLVGGAAALVNFLV